MIKLLHLLLLALFVTTVFAEIDDAEDEERFREHKGQLNLDLLTESKVQVMVDAHNQLQDVMYRLSSTLKTAAQASQQSKWVDAEAVDFLPDYIPDTIYNDFDQCYGLCTLLRTKLYRLMEPAAVDPYYQQHYGSSRHHGRRHHGRRGGRDGRHTVDVDESKPLTDDEKQLLGQEKPGLEDTNAPVAQENPDYAGDSSPSETASKESDTPLQDVSDELPRLNTAINLLDSEVTKISSHLSGVNESRRLHLGKLNRLVAALKQTLPSLRRQLSSMQGSVGQLQNRFSD